MENRTATLDIETSGLLGDIVDYTSQPYKLKKEARIWCISLYDISKGEVKSLVNEAISKEAVNDLLKPYNILVLHNGHKFDLPALKLFGLIDYSIGYMGEKDTLNGREVRLLDSLIMSRLVNPDRLGGHSLSTWGERVGTAKTDYRKELIELGVIEKDLPKNKLFTFFHPTMVPYCEQDCVVTSKVYLQLLDEYKGHGGWKDALQQEHKLADLAFRRESLGFYFDKDLALQNLAFLNEKMEELSKKVTPLLPKKPFNKGELDTYTAPKNQIKADGTLTNYMQKFLERMDATYDEESNKVWYKDKTYTLPLTEPLEIEREATIDDNDVVKEYLIELGWNPSEWSERDLTKNSKKQVISVEKRKVALNKYVQETLSGRYTQGRLQHIGATVDNLASKLNSQITGNRGVIVRTAPKVRVGVTKEMCPNLIKLGDKVDFAKDFADYTTYKHRRNSIAGGDTEDMDFDQETPNTGYLSAVREDDGRIPTPAIEIGASTCRYTHSVVANIPRTTSLFGKEMRSLFGCGKDYIQFGFDYSSLEARIEGNFVYSYEGGKELAESLLAEKPNDTHTITGLKHGISRDDAKSVNYAILYGASANKFTKMLGFTKPQAEEFYKNYWDANPALKQLKEDKEREWIQSGKKYITSIDGRRINIRSQHSILNALFQSSGVICAKYVLVKFFQKIEALGYGTDIFKSQVSIAEMISYHDECQFMIKPDLIDYTIFETKDEAKDFKDNWSGDQLGSIQEGKNNKYYIAMPNVVSKTITESIAEVEREFDMKVSLGYEYVVGRNWADCH